MALQPMNTEAQEIFDSILKLDPEELNKDQRDFVRARRGYLNKEQAEKYNAVLERDEKPEPVSEEDKTQPEIPVHLKEDTDLEGTDAARKGTKEEVTQKQQEKKNEENEDTKAKKFQGTKAK